MEMKADQHGLTFLPLFSGERAPGWAADARGAITGLSLGTTSQEIVRAGLEGISYRVGLIFELLKSSLSDQAQVIASGGALLHSQPLLRILSDVLNRQVVTSRVSEASARGAALLALEKLGIYRNVSEAPIFSGEAYSPIKENHAIYMRAVERQKSLYHQVIQP
jgi:gluconokinase